MDEFRNMKLVRKEEDKIVAVNITVDFDKTKHLSDNSIKRRKCKSNSEILVCFIIKQIFYFSGSGPTNFQGSR